MSAVGLHYFRIEHKLDGCRFAWYFPRFKIIHVVVTNNKIAYSRIKLPWPKYRIVLRRRNTISAPVTCFGDNNTYEVLDYCKILQFLKTRL